MKRLLLICAVVFCAGSQSRAQSSYFVYDNWGGSWSDAEKSPVNDEDDLMCWAAAASNVLDWTGWGRTAGLTDTDQIFGCYQDHWTDQGGSAYYGWDWWFDGTNDKQGESPWAQVDAAGGGFYPSYSFADYVHFSLDDSQAMGTVQQYLESGYGTTLSLTSDSVAHAVTCWGFEYGENTDDFLGLYLTDSDDDKGDSSPEDELRYYEVSFDDASDRWYLQNYYEYNDIFISEVLSLERMPSVPVPGAVLLGSIGTVIIGCVRKRNRL